MGLLYLLYYQIINLLTMYRSLNAAVTQPKNCQWGVSTRIYLKNIKNCIWQICHLAVCVSANKCACVDGCFSYFWTQSLYRFRLSVFELCQYSIQWAICHSSMFRPLKGHPQEAHLMNISVKVNTMNQFQNFTTGGSFWWTCSLIVSFILPEEDPLKGWNMSVWHIMLLKWWHNNLWLHL